MNLSSMELNGSVEPIVLMVSLEVLILDDNHFTRTPPGLERLKQVKRLSFARQAKWDGDLDQLAAAIYSLSSGLLRYLNLAENRNFKGPVSASFVDALWNVKRYDLSGLEQTLNQPPTLAGWLIFNNPEKGRSLEQTWSTTKIFEVTRETGGGEVPISILRMVGEGGASLENPDKLPLRLPEVDKHQTLQRSHIVNLDLGGWALESSLDKLLKLLEATGATLEKLNLSDNPQIGAAVPEGAFIRFPVLKELDVSECGTKDGFTSPWLIMAAVKSSESLKIKEDANEGTFGHTDTKLDLSGWGLRPVDAKFLADALLVNTSLNSIDLSQNELCGIKNNGYGTYDATGIKAIADTISVSSSMTSLK